MKKMIQLFQRAWIAVLLTLAITPIAAWSQQNGGAVLMQEDFESTFVNDPNCRDGSCNVPAGWRVWFIPHRETDPQGVNYPPIYSQTNAPNRVKSGAAAQRLSTENRTFTAGIYRVIENVKVGSKLRFSMWGQSWSTNDNSPISARPSTDIKLKIGIDPAAEGDAQPSPFNGRVVWSAEQDAKDAFVQFVVEAEAKTSTVIVWTYATMRDVVRHNEVFWDDALLEVIVPAAATATISPTPTAMATTTESSIADAGAAIAAAQPSGGMTYTVKAGDTLFGIALEHNKTVDDLRRLNQLQNDLLSIGQVLIIEPPSAQTQAAQAEPTPSQPAAESGATSEAAVAMVQSQPASGEATATSSVGALCVQAYFDNNGNGLRDAGEDLTPGIVFNVTSGGESKGSYTSDGVSEPYCFGNLAAGAYTVSAVIGPEYVTTTPLNDTANVGGGTNTLFSLGIRRADAAYEVIEYTPTPTAEDAGTNGGPNVLAILATLSGALMILASVGFGALFFLQSRRL
ncbi:MAG: LysM peptidoglycan-binding domain-containing protein [Anaerolineae bacterium]|nr:LysM peptidoglycan-binding domain-containing protein [Thermoflexales bacterium]MDW8407584.1 LysM peptidoglycan-binding domain-containing protein [Anaerolineae bacterium]